MAEIFKNAKRPRFDNRTSEIRRRHQRADPKVLKLQIPPSLLISADKVIE
jgi:hypothetical protein